MRRDIEDLLQEARRAWPDPVDLFEDRLASKLGLERGPGLSLAEWRRRRVAFIDSFPDDETGATAAAVERDLGGGSQPE